MAFPWRVKTSISFLQLFTGKKGELKQVLFFGPHLVVASPALGSVSCLRPLWACLPADGTVTYCYLCPCSAEATESSDCLLTLHSLLLSPSPLLGTCYTSCSANDICGRVNCGRKAVSSKGCSSLFCPQIEDFSLHFFFCIPKFIK